ncbi:MAG: hypothetical protein ACJA0X_001554 [Cyclobacteriaceae bacterium]|jgi:hypothetical protein
MKKRILKITSLFLVIVLMSSNAAFALSTNSIEIEERDLVLNINNFEEDFLELNELESIILAQGTYDLSELKKVIDKDLIDTMSSINSMKSTQGFDFSNFDIVSGLWGFLCCPIGFFVVAVNKDKSKDEKISFWLGVAVTTVISAATSPVYIGSF